MHLFQMPVELLHDVAGLPWWGAIVGASVLLRLGSGYVLLTSLRAGAHMQGHMDNLQAIQRQMQAAVSAEAKAEAAKAMRAYYLQHKINPVAMLKPLLQLPVLLGAFWAIQRYARDAHLVPGFMDGGVLWLGALHLADPTGAVPVATMLLSVASVWANPNVQGFPQADLTPRGMRLLFSTLAGGFSYFTFFFPAVRGGGAVKSGGTTGAGAACRNLNCVAPSQRASTPPPLTRCAALARALCRRRSCTCS